MILNKFKNSMKLSTHRVFLLSFYVTIGFSFVFAMGVALLNYGEVKILSLDWFFLIIFSFLNTLYIILWYVIILFIILFLLSTKMLFSPEFIDDFFVFKIREYKITFIWIIGIFFFLFLVIVILLWISLFVSNPEDFVKMVKDFGFTLIASLEISVVGLALLFASKLQEPPKLESSLADKITPKLIARDPDSAIRKAFACCEEKLKQKAESENFGKILIKEAFGDWSVKNGCHKEGSLEYKNDKNQYKQKDICDLMIGIFGMYRNSYMHGVCEEVIEQNSEQNLEEAIQENSKKSTKRQKLTTILTLIDEFVQIIDESELRSKNEKDDKSNNKT